MLSSPPRWFARSTRRSQASWISGQSVTTLAISLSTAFRSRSADEAKAYVSKLRAILRYLGTCDGNMEEGSLRAGHIPSSKNVPWAKAAAEDGSFKTRAELDAVYRDGAGLGDGDDVVVLCRIGERSSHTWFVLTHLLGFEGVRNYDGSWTEWGSAVRVPIVQGAEPGELPAR